jgi:hypothetical protein
MRYVSIQGFLDSYHQLLQLNAWVAMADEAKEMANFSFAYHIVMIVCTRDCVKASARD